MNPKRRFTFSRANRTRRMALAILVAVVLPGYEIVDLPLEHPMFSVLYRLDHLPQIPAINSWFRNRQDSEIGPY